MIKNNMIIFTSSYPYGRGEQFFEDELKLLKDDFKITIQPYYYGHCKKSRINNENIIIEKPLLNELNIINIIKYSNYTVKYLKAIIKIIFLKEKNKKWQILEILRAIYGLSNLKIKDNKYDIYYFYWGVGASYYIPLIREMNKNAKILCKFHGSDLYEEINNGSIPLRKEIFNSNIVSITISDFGKRYIQQKYNYQSICIRLGTNNNYGIGKPSYDYIFRIVSCSNIIEIKRVELIADIICQLNIPLEWYHFGDGPNMKSVKEIVKKYKKEDKCFLFGYVSKETIIKHYYLEPNDLFINLSISEGIPVSIMEAQSFGIPSIALNITGLSEIIHPELIINQNNRKAIEDKIYFYYCNWLKDKYFLRKEVRQIWYEKYNMIKNYECLRKVIIS